ncbi:MAG TPA: GDSL-type esterase/lipase family protein [Planctomycetota bacterium]|nr:GDSL-type esterase/lipase family protein [Planctomycetota bacterium]
MRLHRNHSLIVHFGRLLACAALAILFGRTVAAESTAEFPFKTNDRVAWIGSSSTRIGTWCRTMEFLLRTRHPELKLTFTRNTTGGGTFLTGIKNLPVWLGDFHPTYVLFNYGGNDAAAGQKGIAQFHLNMQKCLEIAQEAGARVEFTAPQSGDVRCTAQLPFDNRKLYAEDMAALARANHWVVYDTHHPLETFQLGSQRDVQDFTMNRDRIHLTDCGYVAWGFYLYDEMNPPTVESRAELSADGKVVSAKNCAITNVIAANGVIEFTRADRVLPLLPPDPIPAGNSLLKNLPTTPGAAAGMAMKDAIKDLYKTPSTAPKSSDPSAAAQSAPALANKANEALSLSIHESTNDGPPTSVGAAVAGAVNSSNATPAKPGTPPFKIPAAQVTYAAKFGALLPSRKLVPLEKYSRYMLQIGGLPPGQYEVSCEGKPVGRASEKELAAGVNLNTLLLDAKNPAPWGEWLKDIWVGKRLEEIGKTAWKFRVAPVAR